jgi:hypothetical protein
MKSQNEVPNQTKQILKHLMGGKKITPYTALVKFGCLRLGARCWDLRQDGVPVQSEMIKLDNGKRVASYYLLPEDIKRLKAA